MQHYGYQLKELENMMPWEREIYTALLIDYLREKKEAMERPKQQAKHIT